MSPDGLKPPPEEKLLRLIRGKAPQAAPATAPAGRAASAAVASSASAQLMARVNWSQAATIVLVAVVIVEAVWVVVQLVRPLPDAAVAVPHGLAPTPVPAPQLEPMPSVAASAARPLFNAPADTVAASTRPAMSDSAKLLATRLTLTGIISSDPPQAIIEDTQTQKTYMVTVGQPLAEGAVLEQVLDNRVILDFDGEKVELGL